MHAKTMIYLGLILGCGIAILIAGCSSDEGVDPSPTLETGTVRIEVMPTGLAAPWHLVGPDDFDEQGTGDREISKTPIGSYTMTWGTLENWTCESVASQSQQLASGGSIVFNGVYESLAGGLTIIQPSVQTVWRLGQSDVEIRWLGGDEQQVTLSLYAQDIFVAEIASQIANGGEYLTWDVPAGLVPGSGYKLRIVQGALEYWSEEFRVGPEVEIMSPDADTRWGHDTEVLITWGTALVDDTVQIDLYRGDLLVAAIAVAAPNSGSFVWQVPASLDVASDYEIHLLIGATETVSATFAVGVVGALDVSEPTSTTVWQQGQQDVMITWSGGDVGQPVDLFLYQFGTTAATIATATENDGSHTTWDVPVALATGPYQVRVVQGALETLSDMFFVEAPPPPLAITEPSAATVWETGQLNVPISWTGGVSGQEVSLYLHRGGIAVATIASNTANDGSHTSWDVSAGMTPGTDYQVRVVQGAGDALSEEFEIRGVETPLAIVVPNSSMAWTPGQQNVLVTWTGGDPAQDVEITLHKGATQVATIAAATVNDGTDATWDVPLDQSLGDDYRVRVSQGADADYSDYFRIESDQLLEVTQPASETSWYQGLQDVTITWNGGDPAQSVSLYLYKNTLQVATIASDTPNDGSMTTWDVPEDLLLGTDYRVQVTQGAEDDFSDYFEITAPPIQVMQPTGATVWRRGDQNVLVSWTGGDPAQTIRLYLLKNGSSVAAISSSIPNSGEYSVWDVPTNLTIGDDYQVQVVQGSMIGVSEEFTVDPPLLVVSQPDAATIWEPGQINVPITWTGGDPSQNVSLALFSGSTLVETITASTDNWGGYAWDVPESLPYTTSYRVRLAQGEEVAYSAYFQIGQPPLQVTYPDASTIGYAGGSMFVTWTGGDASEPVSLYLYKSGAQVATLAYTTLNNGTRNCYLPGTLALGSDYRVQVAQGIDYDYSSYFEIKPQLSVSEPDSFTVWNPGQQNVPITWTGGDISAPVTLELVWGDSPDETITIATDTANDGVHSTWDVPTGLASGQYYQIRISQGSRYAYSDGFQIGLVITSPGYGTYWYPGQTNALITWTGGFVGQAVDIELYRGETFIVAIASGTANDGTETWNVPVESEMANDYNIRIRQGDISARSWNFWIGDPASNSPE